MHTEDKACETCKAPVGEGRIWVAPGRVTCSMRCSDGLEARISSALQEPAPVRAKEAGNSDEDLTTEIDVESMLAVVEGGLR